MARLLVWIVSGGLAIALGTAVVVFFYCPCERVPGGYLLGDEAGEPVRDWAFANDDPRCELQVSGVLPHSVTLNCMASPDGELFVSCSRCEGKYWSGLALENPQGRIRIGDRVYPVHLERLTGAAALDKAWQARSAKLGVEAERPDHWWSFQLRSR